MKVLIIGGGTVGSASAKSALAGNDVYIIEKDDTVAETIKNSLPVSVLKGDASNPNVLIDALDRILPDFLFAAVSDDGINLFICDVAKHHLPDVRTISCVRNPEFLKTEGYEGVDILISPDIITSEKMNRIALLENAVNYEKLDFDDYALTTFRIERGHEVVGKTVMDIELPRDCTIVCIYREDRAITQIATTEIHADDRIVVLGTSEATSEFNKLIGIKKDAREFVILGAGQQGLNIARRITELGSRYFVKVLDSDLERCREASKSLRKTIVVNGNVIDPQFLKSESIDRADVLISVMNADERNLLACMTAMRFGIRKIISRYSIEEYEGVFKYAGIESVIGWHRIISNEVTRIIRLKENSTVHVMENPGDYFLTFTIDESSPLKDQLLGDLEIPAGVNICGLRRNGTTHFTDLVTRFQLNDEVLIFAHSVDSIRLASLLGRSAPEL